MRSETQHHNRRLLCCFAVLLGLCLNAHASVSLLLEEPFGRFGDWNPTGHAAIYLNNVCAETPTQLRPCRAGEMGVVISRYHHIQGYDWIAIPLIPYLYAVDDLADVPETATPALEAQLRDSYRREHLLSVAPDAPGGATPVGEWIQLVGSSYDRQIYGFQLDTTPEQDAKLMAKLNDSRNHSHFNLFYRNCADFSRTMLRVLYPGSIRRNALADFGLTTPKHLARSVVHFGTDRPDLGYRTFQIPQVPGTLARSRHVDGIAESLVRSKKYLLPLVYVSPVTTATLVAAYVGTGRFRPPKDAPLMPELSPEPGSLVLRQDTISIGAMQGLDAQRFCCYTPIASAPVAVTALQEGMGGCF